MLHLRKAGTPGSIKAQKYIQQRLEKIGVQAFKNSFTDSFELKFIESPYPGKNIQAFKKGHSSEKLIVISAHYDHLGIKNNETYNGANDNATGTAVLIDLISRLENIETNNSIVYLFFDAEEFGKEGVKHFLSNNTEIHHQILLNFNIDMLNCDTVNELYICGTKYYPKFKNILAEKVKDYDLNFGYDLTIDDKANWLESSDHREFANWNIPFLYLGSENDQNYNTPEDDFDNINLECFCKTGHIIEELILALDQQLQ